MYMSYCRNEGTLSELRAVLSAADEYINHEMDDRMSDREIDCFRKMVIEFYSWLSDSALINEYGELDDDALDEICAAMAEGPDDGEEE